MAQATRETETLRLYPEEIVRIQEAASRESAKTGYVVSRSVLTRKWVLDGLKAYEAKEGLVAKGKGSK